jgi:hypothetical protein
MPSFLAACVVAIVLALGAALILNQYQPTAEHTYTSPTGTRLS